MGNFARYQLRLANERIADRIREAADARHAADARPGADRHSFRRSIGHGIIRIGERLAEEPHFQPARSR